MGQYGKHWLSAIVCRTRYHLWRRQGLLLPGHRVRMHPAFCLKELLLCPRKPHCSGQCLCRYLPGVTLATLAEAHYHHAYPIDLSERRVQHIALHLLQVGLAHHVSMSTRAEDKRLSILMLFCKMTPL